MTVATVVGMAMPNTREKTLSYRRVEWVKNPTRIHGRRLRSLAVSVSQEGDDDESGLAGSSGNNGGRLRPNRRLGDLFVTMKIECPAGSIKWAERRARVKSATRSEVAVKRT